MKHFVFDFPDIADEFKKVSLKRNGSSKEYHFDISLNDIELEARKLQHIPSLASDLIDLGLAIYMSDWLSRRKNDDASSLIEIALPVRNKDLFAKQSEDLKNVLGWFTGDKWEITFQKRSAESRNVESQQVIPFKQKSNLEIALWSGGLDSLAGLYNRYNSNPETKFVLVGTGFNNKITSKQKSLLNILSNEITLLAQLVRIPFRLSNSGNIKRHTFMRSRGLTFMLIGAAVALCMGKKELFVYENGIGAINLPYRNSEVGLDHTRAVNPISLFKTSKFISSLLREGKFTVINPFIFTTKGEMCRLMRQKKCVSPIFESFTCDSPHRSSPSQCGYCTSCLLRRQSLLAAGISDKTKYVLEEGDPTRENLKAPINAMLFQVEKIRKIVEDNKGEEKWIRFIELYPEIERIFECINMDEKRSGNKIKESLLNMYKIYCEEWDSSASQILDSYSIS